MLGLGSGLTSVSEGLERFLPTEVSNLSLWFQNATGVAVGQWDDQSGNDNHMTQGTSGDQAAVSEGGLLFVSGEGDHYDLEETVEISAQEGFTVFLACKLTSITSNMGILSSNSASQFLEFPFAVSAGDNVRIKLGGTNTTISPGDGSEDNFSADEKFLVTVVREAGGTGNLLLYKNGSLLAQDSQASNTGSGDFLAVGLRNSDRFFNGIMHELLFYESALSGDDLTNVHSYLTGKLGL